MKRIFLSLFLVLALVVAAPAAAEEAPTYAGGQLGEDMVKCWTTTIGEAGSGLTSVTMVPAPADTVRVSFWKLNAAGDNYAKLYPTRTGGNATVDSVITLFGAAAGGPAAVYKFEFPAPGIQGMFFSAGDCYFYGN